MKRHRTLAILSREHHRGLILAQLLKEDSPPYKGLPTDPAGKLEYLKKMWEEELSAHFRKEEEILFPAVLKEEGSFREPVDDLIAEHREFSRLIGELEMNETLVKNLDAIGRLLEGHIRKEERVLFEEIQEFIDDSKLDEIHDQLDQGEYGSRC